jgi:hypothetical protein
MLTTPACGTAWSTFFQSLTTAEPTLEAGTQVCVCGWVGVGVLGGDSSCIISISERAWLDPWNSQPRPTNPFLHTLLQTQLLDTFCKSPCGPVFNKVTADWRTWCDANRATFGFDASALSPYVRVGAGLSWPFFVAPR